MVSTGVVGAMISTTVTGKVVAMWMPIMVFFACLLYTSDAADERSSVDLGGRRIIKKKKTT